MDERRTLAILAWTVGGVVGIMFILNGIALSFVESGPALLRTQLASQHAPPSPAAQSRTAAAARGG